MSKVTIYRDPSTKGVWVEIDGQRINAKHCHVSAGNGKQAEVMLVIAAEHVVRRQGTAEKP